MVKQLRDKTGAGMMDCKEALTASDGDFNKAIDYLRKKGMAAATKRSSKAAKEGTIASYIHMGGKIGVMVELNCETDFVAKNDEFKALAYDIAMQVAATSPEFNRKENIPEESIRAVREMLLKDVADLNKDEAMKEKILDGKVDAYFKDKILLEQPFIKDETLTVKSLIEKSVQKFGERIEVARFSRFSVAGK